MADPKPSSPRSTTTFGGGGSSELDESEVVGKEIAFVEDMLASLRGTYEQYFMGVERRPPSDKHREVKRRIGLLRTAGARQTAVKFRIDTLANRFMTFERLWNKTLQEMENGTYTRDVFKARLHAKERAEKAAAERAAKSKAEAEKAVPPKEAPKKDAVVTKDAQAGVNPVLSAVTKPVPAVPPGMKSPAPSAPGVPIGDNPITDSKMRAIYNAYVTAKKQCNEDVSKISYESLAGTLRKQVPELMKAHKAKSVEFKVIIKDGKAVLRALPKEN